MISLPLLELRAGICGVYVSLLDTTGMRLNVWILDWNLP
jgi:hypothetical protein